MKNGLTHQQKVMVTIACFAVAIVGFMIKLPSAFRHFDKELHALFYFLAAALLNVFFAKRNFIRHAVIFIALYVFGATIEYSQAYSNRFYRTRIHGRFDLEDLQANFTGLVAFSMIWLLCIAVMLVYKKATAKSNG